MSNSSNISKFIGKNVLYLNNKKKLGKISNIIFYPGDKIVYGFVLRRPPFLLVFKRKNVYFARNDIIFNEQAPAMLKQDAPWPEPKMFKDFVIWLGQDIYSQNDTKIGSIRDINVDMDTGQINYLIIGNSPISDLLLGKQKLDASYIIGLDYFNGDCCIRIKDSFIPQKDKDGIAYNAGKVAAKINSPKGRHAQENISKITCESIETGAQKLGSQLGKTKEMFSSFKEEFKEAQK